MSLYSGSKKVVVTYGNIILSNDSALLLEDRINNCTSEEADARLVRHAIRCIEKGYNNIVVRTVDTDVLVLLICFRSYMNKLGCAKVYALMGKGMGLDYYDVGGISLKLGMCNGLLVCAVSSIFGISKCTLWDSLLLQENLTELLDIFQELSNQPESVTTRQIDVLEIFVQRVYYPKNLHPKGINKEKASTL